MGGAAGLGAADGGRTVNTLSGGLEGLGRVMQRLRGADMLQVLALFLAAQLFVVAVRWPGHGGSNETWFTLAPVRLLLLALAAMAYGSAESRGTVESRRATLGALLAFAALSAPFDVASYAASYPAVPLWWSAVLPFVATIGYFGIGLALGRAATWARVGPLVPLLVPAVVVAGVWIDVRLGISILNPLTATLAVSVVHGVAALVLAALTLIALARRRPVAAPAPPSRGSGS